MVSHHFQEILAPWNDNRARLQTRLTRWLSRDQQRSPSSVNVEASVLARWCGYMDEGETPVNAAVGLAFLYRHLDARAWRGGALLLLEQAHLAQEAGDGLSICDAVIDKSIGERPFLVIATLSAEAIAARGSFALAIPGGSVLNMLMGVSEPKWAEDTVLAYVNHKCVAMDDGELATHAKAEAKFLSSWEGVKPVLLSGSTDSKAEADAYEKKLRELSPATLPLSPEGFPVFDLMLVGVGDDGLPVGVQLLGPALSEPTIYQAAVALEAAAPGEGSPS